MKKPHTRRLEEGGGMQHFRDALAAVLVQRIEFPRGVLVTVVDAKITSDTRNAKGVLSVFPEDKQLDVLKVLKLGEHEIKDGLAERLRLRRIPNLHWSFDTSEAYVGTIDDTINELKKKGEL